ncbi:MAG: hypothetical protein NWE93_01355 [Candidatus Bathyarchaeota archaeon]|nr:hypothetical protein [Candidatus Bathyarchaeota archaeon]
MKKQHGEKKKIANKLGLCLVAASMLFLLPTQTSAQTPQPPAFEAPSGTLENNQVFVGVWLNNIYTYEYRSGTYTLDMFLYFFWIDPNITTIDWYLLNGYPVNPATTVLVSSDRTSQVKYEIYRITAVCNTPPDAKDFPLDSIDIKVIIELITHGYDTELEWLVNQTGLDSSFKNSGWVTTNVNLTTSSHVYPLGVELPRAEMTITQHRQLILSSIQSMIPPAIFAIVSAFSFLFSLKDPASVGLRLGLNTSMLVTTLLYNFTVSASVPPSSTISIYGLFLLSILVFITLNLMVTIAGFVQYFHYKKEKQTRAVNRWGFLLSIIIPLLFFLLLYIFRG